MNKLFIGSVGAVLIALAAIACGSSDSSGNNGGSGGISPSKLNECNKGAGSGSTVTCTGQAEYDTCIESKCATQYQKCLGAGYKSGNFAGGACESYMGCIAKAADPCNNSCGVPTGDCLNCFMTDLSSCQQSSGCAEPVCTVSGGTGGGTGAGGSVGAGGGVGAGGSTASGTCADLKACCDKTTGSVQTGCNAAYTQANGDNSVCAQVYTSLKSLCP
jgi:hypothetical protein